MPEWLDWDKVDEELAEARRKESDLLDTPEARAKHDARVKAEFAVGVREGWHDEDGNSLLPETDDDEDDVDEDDEENQEDGPSDRRP